MPRTKKTADVKATETKTPEVKEVGKAAPVEAVKEPVKAEPKKAGRKPAAKKAAPAKKETAKSEVKAEPKKAGRKPAAKKAAAPAKTEKKAAKPVTTSVLQVAGNEFDFDKVVKAVEGLKKKNEGNSLEIYIKPEDNAIYYVVNGKGGKKIDI